MLDNTIAVAMSGGVDSSTVAAMLRAEGYDLVGLTLQLWNQRRLAGKEGMPEQVVGRCCSLDDVYDARHVAEALGIPYYVVNEEERFRAGCGAALVQEYPERAHTDPVLALQQPSQVRSTAGARAPDRRGPHRDRTLRAQRVRPGARSLDPEPPVTKPRTRRIFCSA
jgi:hypothetical protein